jgi:hypothetical protein
VTNQPSERPKLKVGANCRLLIFFLVGSPAKLTQRAVGANRQINRATGSFGSVNFRIEIFDNCQTPTTGVDDGRRALIYKPCQAP